MKRNPTLTEATKAALRNAFWSLYQKKPIEQITVREIADLAGYNRSTFYQYYKDTYDILEQMEGSILTEIRRLGSLLEQTAQETSLAEIIQTVFGRRYQEAAALRAFLMLEWNHSFERRLIDCLKELLIRLFPWEEDQLELEGLFLEYHINGVLSVFKCAPLTEEDPLGDQLLMCLSIVNGIPLSAFSDRPCAQLFKVLAPKQVEIP